MFFKTQNHHCVEGGGVLDFMESNRLYVIEGQKIVYLKLSNCLYVEAKIKVNPISDCALGCG